MEQAAAYAPIVHILDIPVPQVVDPLADVMRFFDTLLLVPEQAIEVPKILLDDVPVRTPMRDAHLVEQLVEVPTIVSFSSLQRTVEQHVDIPVPRRGGRNAGLQGFLLPRQSPTASQLSLERISERIAEQFVDFPVSRGASKIFAQDKVHPLLRMFQLAIKKAWLSLVKGFLEKKKRCEVGSALESGCARQCQLIHAGGSARGCARVWRQRGLGRGDGSSSSRTAGCHHVPATMQPKFQQSFLFTFWWCPDSVHDQSAGH